MKLFKKSLILLVVVTMIISSVTAFADFSEITLAKSADTVAAGETITISADFGSLVNAKGMEIHFTYDEKSFSIDASDNEDYNFGTSKKPVYYPNYFEGSLLENMFDEMSIFKNLWTTFECNATGNTVSVTSTDTGGYIIEEGDDAEDMYPYNIIGINFIANDDIEAGTYTFTVIAKVSDANAGVITSTKDVTVTVEGDEPEEDEIFDTVDPKAANDAITVGDVIGEGKGAIELKTGATQLAVFGKAPAGGLKAKEYGIMFGDLKFPGIVDVTENQIWCIKLVAPEGVNDDDTAFSGEYTYKAYIGETVSAERKAQTVTATAAQ